jgi:elongation factor G
MSISTSVLPVEWDGFKNNFLDTPGSLDFIGEVNGALRIARGAVVVIDASSGVEVGTEKVWGKLRRRSIPSIIFVNKMDKENIQYEKLLVEIREKLGKKAVPFCTPIGREKDFEGFVNVVDMKARIYNGTTCEDAEIWEEKKEKVSELHDMIVESVAETSEELMEKFFEGEEFTDEEIKKALRVGILKGELVPIIVGSAQNKIGIHTLLDMINSYLPTPLDERLPYGEAKGSFEIIERKVDKDEALSALVFKIIVDPFVGKISITKVRSGTLKSGQEVYNSTKDEVEKVGNIFYLRGKEQIETDIAIAGDIVAITKLNNTTAGDTLCDKDNPIVYNQIRVPQPNYFKAIKPTNEKDEDKIGEALRKIQESDLTVVLQRNPETKQLLIGGLGVKHLSIILERLESEYKVKAEYFDPLVIYRETITGNSDVQGKYKKQSGGSGQYGDVHIKFSPTNEDFEFEEKIFGGSVPKNYIPAVQKGLEDSLQRGVLAGVPVIGLKAVLYDGSYHSVDSSELAFKMAASLAFKEGCKEANPVLLEPVMKVKITVPGDYLGDVMGDINKRRGIINGIEQNGLEQIVNAEVPQAEMLSYTIDLKQMTQARGEFEMEFVHYDEVPKMISDKVIEEIKNRD